MSDTKQERETVAPAHHLSHATFWSPNTPETTRVLVFDIDNTPNIANLCDPGIPRPTYILETRPGRIQIGWFLEHDVNTTPLPDGTLRPSHRLLKALRHNLTKLLGADPHANPASKSRNPFNENARAWFNPSHVTTRLDTDTGHVTTNATATLASLYNHLHAAGLWENPPAENEPHIVATKIITARKTKTPLYLPPADDEKWGVGERDNQIFTHLRRYAMVGGNLERYADYLNTHHTEVPLKSSEIRSIVRSVERRTNTYLAATRTDDENRYFITGPNKKPHLLRAPQRTPRTAGALYRLLSHAARSGGSKNTPAQQRARRNNQAAATAATRSYRTNRAEIARNLNAQGWTLDRIAQRLKCSTRTIRRYLTPGVPATPKQPCTFGPRQPKNLCPETVTIMCDKPGANQDAIGAAQPATSPTTSGHSSTQQCSQAPTEGRGATRTFRHSQASRVSRRHPRREAPPPSNPPP